MKIKLGGERLGSGNKMDVNIHGFGKSTHDLSYIWKNTQSFGTCVPFINLLGLDQDEFEIDFDVEVLTKPTVGPMYGSAKIQGDVAIIPLRLYLGALMVNEKNLAQRMSTVRFPQVYMEAPNLDLTKDLDNQQINPSSIWKYLGVSGLGKHTTGTTVGRSFNALNYLAYHDFCSQYYANKQEKIGAVIHTPRIAATKTITGIIGTNQSIPQDPGRGVFTVRADEMSVKLLYAPNTTAPRPEEVLVLTDIGWMPITTYWLYWVQEEDGAGNLSVEGNSPQQIGTQIYAWRYILPTDSTDQSPQVTTFPLVNIDGLKKGILKAYTEGTAAYQITAQSGAPWGLSLKSAEGLYSKNSSQEGLWVKTKQSDRFQNWMNKEDVLAITNATRVSTTGNSFSIDALQTALKVWEAMNRNQLTDGTWSSWQEVNYGKSASMMINAPMYVGGISKELVFQEVQAMAQTQDTPLGTLGGRGRLSQKKKGGKIKIKLDEPCIIMGILSATPRLDYTQGNDWQINLKTMADLHTPIMDKLQYQDLITDEMAYWDTNLPNTSTVALKSAGKQLSWTQYQTAVNKSYGNFAIKNSEMFMIFAQRYEPDTSGNISNLSTYIDPAMFNYMWAETRRDAMNLWVQASVNVKATRVMSANQFPSIT